MRFGLIYAALATGALARPRAKPQICGQAGLQWAEYDNTQGPDLDSVYSNFDPAVYKTTTPNYNSTFGSVGGFYYGGSSNATLYNSTYSFSSTNFALNHRGYFYAPKTGNYTISTPSVDDILYVWIGFNAYLGWQANNAVLTSSLLAHSANVTFPATAGNYIPIRLVYGQATGSAGLRLSITGPDNLVILNSTQPSDYLIQYGCRRVAKVAPRYLDFGAER